VLSGRGTGGRQWGNGTSNAASDESVFDRHNERWRGVAWGVPHTSVAWNGQACWHAHAAMAATNVSARDCGGAAGLYASFGVGMASRRLVRGWAGEPEIRRSTSLGMSRFLRCPLAQAGHGGRRFLICISNPRYRAECGVRACCASHQHDASACVGRLSCLLSPTFICLPSDVRRWRHAAHSSSRRSGGRGRAYGDLRRSV